MRRPLALLVGSVLAAALGLSTLAGPPAGAATRPFADAAGDVRILEFSDDADEAVTVASDTTDGDVLKTQVTHTMRRLQVTTKYADLTPGKTLRGWQFLVRGSNGVRRLVEVETMKGRPQGVARVSRARSYQEVCRGLVQHRVDYARDVLTFSVPRRCLDFPAYARLQGVSFWVRTDAAEQAFTFHYDDPFRTGGGVRQIGRTFTGAVQRG